MSPIYSAEDSQLIASLHMLSKRSPKLVKSSTYPAPADPQTVVRSWKMNEFKYYDIPSPFPTLARGLFTVELPAGATDENITDADPTAPAYRIVARGYDKFFNIGEVPWTTWPSLEAHTAPPYTLSLKSNGCIIFIAALNPSKLLITSKHSIGPIAGSPVSHAEAGEAWIRKYLQQKGRTEEQLAARLWENNWTAISELCDDSFEEHVLAYPPDKTGLHLHGINESMRQFKTLPQQQVDAFAEEWGFIKTVSITMDSIADVKAFTAECGKTGQWNGEAVEGFVVRTHITEPPVEGKGKQKAAPDASPYDAGSTFFFKVKFDEPYMMYRDWREVTKSLLSSKAPMSAANIPKSKMKRPETKVYLGWVIEEIKRDRKAFEEYNKGKGIIQTRERFLAWLETENGQVDLKEREAEAEDGMNKQFKKTIIVPVAIPGCGKTAVSVALSHIFGFGHTQSDDTQGKKAAPRFIKNVTSLLAKHDVVIADKNNHLRQHRQALRDATNHHSPPVRLLALNWSLDKPRATIHRICGDRVLLRGDNHQTLRADATAKTHEDVIWMFINTAEELAAGEVDAVVEMDVEATLEGAVARAVDGCVRVLGLPRPSEGAIRDALGVIRSYVPAVKTPDESGRRAVGGPRYFGLLAEVDFDEVLGGRLALGNDVPRALKDFWALLTEGGRVEKRPHVTIVHRNSLPEENALWERCVKLQQAVVPPLFRARLGNLVWDGRVMAATVDDLEVAEGGDGAGEFIQGLEEELRCRLHITVGTRDAHIAAVEAKMLVEKWRKGVENGGIRSFNLQGIAFQGRIKGLKG